MSLTTTDNVIYPGLNRKFESWKNPGLMLARPNSGTVTLQVATYNSDNTANWRDHATWSTDAEAIIELAHNTFRVVLTGDASYEFRT